MRIFNFSSGPAVMPVPVLERAREEMLSIAGSGMSVMEISHRSPLFGSILEHAQSGLRDLLEIPENYRVLFLHGGATAQFAQVPLNLLADGLTAEFVVTGRWGLKAVDEARRHGNAKVIVTTEESGFRTIPDQTEIDASPEAAYLHYTSNETIDGVEFYYEIEAGGVPVVCDASSNLLSKPFDVNKYGMIYAGAQKNIGPSGVTLAIIRDDLIARVRPGTSPLYDYRVIAENNSMVNTPNTWGIYLIGLVCDWLKDQGGLSAMKVRNAAKAKLIYDAIDTSDGFYSGRVERAARSMMNVTFDLPTEALEQEFCDEAERNGMDGLRGHRSAGGIRASIYNAFPVEGVEALVSLMSDFASRRA